jgi:hypothetical protein
MAISGTVLGMIDRLAASVDLGPAGCVEQHRSIIGIPASSASGLR